MPCNFLYGNICIKSKRVTFLNLSFHLCTVISPHNHLFGLRAFTNVQVVLWVHYNRFVHLMTEPQGFRCPGCIVWHVVMSSKLFFHFGKEMKIWQPKVRAISWAIQSGETKTLNLYRSCTRSIVILKDRLLHVRKKWLKSCFQLPQFFMLPLSSEVLCQ
jgi:hypothetical protein